VLVRAEFRPGPEGECCQRARGKQQS
jgi:hypothetical protein